MYLKINKTNIMKNLSNKNSNENPAITVTTYLEEPNMLQILVEKLAECNCGLDYSLKQLPPDWQTIEISSIEAFVSGHIILSGENDLVEIPFVNSFLFTCTKSTKNYFNLTWSSSLS